MALNSNKMLLTTPKNGGDAVAPPSAPDTVTWVAGATQTFDSTSSAFRGMDITSTGRIWATSCASATVMEALRYSDNYGLTWTTIVEEGGWAIAIDGSDNIISGNWISNDVIRRSTNGGSTFTTVNTLMVDQITNIESNKDTDTVIGYRRSHTTTAKYCQSSSDGGATWIENNGADNNVNVGTNCMAHLPGTDLWCRGIDYRVIEVSTDDGTTWTETATTNVEYDNTLVGIGGGAINNTIITSESYGSYVHRSTDFGDSWTAIQVDTANHNIYGIETDSNGVWMVYGSGGWATISYDDGLTWTEMIDGLNCGNTAKNIRTIFYAGNNKWVAGFDGGYCSTGTVS